MIGTRIRRKARLQFMKRLVLLGFCFSLVLVFTLIPTLGVKAESMKNSDNRYIYLELFGEANKNLESDSAEFFVHYNLYDTTLEGINDQSKQLLTNLKNTIKEAQLQSVNMTLENENLYKYSDVQSSYETEVSTEETRKSNEESNEDSNRIYVKYNKELKLCFHLDDTRDLLSLSNIIMSSDPSYVSEITYIQKDKSDLVATTRKLAIRNARDKANFILQNMLNDYNDSQLKLISIQENNDNYFASPRSVWADGELKAESFSHNGNEAQDMNGKDVHRDNLKILFAYDLTATQAEYKENILAKFNKTDDTNTLLSLSPLLNDSENLAGKHNTKMYSNGTYSTDNFVSVLNLTLSTDNHQEINEAQTEANDLRNRFISQLKDKFANSYEILNESFNNKSLIDYTRDNNEVLAYSVNLSYTILVKDAKLIDDILQVANENSLSSNSNPYPYSEAVNTNIPEALFSAIDSNLNKLGQLMTKDLFLSKNILLSETSSSASVNKILSLHNEDKWVLQVFSNADLELID